MVATQVYLQPSEGATGRGVFLPGDAPPHLATRGAADRLGARQAPAGTEQDRTTQTGNRESELSGADEALFYRARLILGDSLPLPSDEGCG